MLVPVEQEVLFFPSLAAMNSARGGEVIRRSCGKGAFLTASALFAAGLGACSSSRSSAAAPSDAAGASASGSGGSAGNTGGTTGQAGGTGESGGSLASGGASGRGGGAGEAALGGASGGGAMNGGFGGGGSAGTTGTAGNAGNAGSAGGVPTEITGWAFDDNRGPFDSYAVTPPTLGGVVSYSRFNGHPGGCLDATLGFTGANEEIRVGAQFSSPRTLIGKTLSAEVFVRAGWNDPTHLGKIRLYLITGAKGDAYAEGATIDFLIGGTWNTLTLDPAAPAKSTGTVDTSLVLGLGVSILSPDVPPNTTLEVYVDNVLVHDAP